MADGESEPAEQRPVSSSHDTLALLSGFPLAPVVAPPWIHRRPAILVRPGDAIPFGRLYRTHLNGSRKLLTARKRVGPIPTRRLTWRRVSHHSSDRQSSPDSSSSSSPSDHSLFGHTPPDTTDADSSTPQRFVHRSLARTPRRSEAFRRWRSAPLSTPYPPTTLESSLGSSSERSLDLSSPSSRPSHKRCRSPTASVPSPIHVDCFIHGDIFIFEDVEGDMKSDMEVRKHCKVIIEQLVKVREKNLFWSINEEVQESHLNLTSVRHITLDGYAVSQDLDEFKTIA
ncbi:hypothetical protein Tco_0649103 [Tanacetum coccineum]